jgi:hypothetical protein
MSRESAVAIATYASVRTKTVWNAAPLVKSPSKTNSNAAVFHSSGFHSGAGVWKIGSTVPKATPRMT